MTAGTLSGGNQQKVVVGREFDGELRLLVLDQPTRGLDVGSIEFIHRQAIAKRDDGVAVVLVSAELDEVLELSDRVAVMYRGRIVKVLDARSTNREEVGPADGYGRARGSAAAGGGRLVSDRPVTPETLRAEHPPQASVPDEPRGRSAVSRVINLALVPAAAIVLALIVGAVIMIASSPLVDGFDPLLPLTAYVALVAGSVGSFDAIINTLVQSTPLVLTGLSVGIGFKAGSSISAPRGSSSSAAWRPPRSASRWEPFRLWPRSP